MPTGMPGRRPPQPCCTRDLGARERRGVNAILRLTRRNGRGFASLTLVVAGIGGRLWCGQSGLGSAENGSERSDLGVTTTLAGGLRTRGRRGL
jgi:hypothetical protein